jgi:hypothetical protein
VGSRTGAALWAKENGHILKWLSMGTFVGYTAKLMIDTLALAYE